MKKISSGVASLKLTVVLLAMAVFTVFCSTLAQKDEATWTVVDEYFRVKPGAPSVIVWIPFRVLAEFANMFVSIDAAHVGGSFPFPKGWVIGGLLLVNLLAAHAVRFKLTWKRSGILLVHAGLIALLLSELVAGLFQVEGYMKIYERESKDFVEDDRVVEFVTVDSSDATFDDVRVVPQGLLKKGGTLRDAELPFDVRVDRFMVNSDLLNVSPGSGGNPATAGTGLRLVAKELPPVSGIETKDRGDAASAYLTLLEKNIGTTIGTYLVSRMLVEPQPVSLAGKTYHLSLRPKRTYKPYEIRLKEFRHEKYIGTETPRNFASLVQLRDPQNGVDREIRIWMNHPLRYSGESLFQAGFVDPKDDPMHRKGTILQVVRNPGWLMPYVSCSVIILGLMVQFGLSLSRFLGRRAKE